MAETTETREEREARWWRGWFEADYSWEGLAKKDILGGGQFGEQTLQDYWRRDPETGGVRDDAMLKAAGELVQFDGRWWHLVHLPPSGRGGVESWKAEFDASDWERVKAMVVERLAAAVETPGTFGLVRQNLRWKPKVSDGRALLDGAVLGGGLLHTNGGISPISLSCRSAAFLWDSDFNAEAFGLGTDFFGAAFLGSAGFDGATFSGDAYFQRATFSGAAKFFQASFSGKAIFQSAIFSSGSDFFNAAFSGITNFYGTIFSGDTAFLSATFSTKVNYSHAIFWGDAEFMGATFSGYADFESATFSSNPFFSGRFEGKGCFHNAVFEGPVTFSAAIAAPERDFPKAFYGARFAGIADFSGAVGEGQGGQMAAAFAEAQFEKALILTDGLDGKQGQVFHKTLLANTRYTAKDQNARDAAFATLESGCRVVKIAMGKARDEVREQAYYRLQLRARHQRQDIDAWEKAIGWLYGVTSEFGSSLWRPLVGLGLLVLVFAVVIYWPWMDWLNIRDADGLGGVFVALNHSLRTLSPFNLLATTGVHPSAAPASLFEVNPAVTFGARLVSGLQSILSTLLIFLFGLAVKRRFQIS